MTVTTLSLPRTWGRALLWPAAALLLIAGCSEQQSVRQALHMCAQVLIPSLFPYMVLSAFTVRSGGASQWGRPLRGMVRHLFRLPDCAAGSLLLGALCGFPVGAQSACALYTRGELTAPEAERLIPLANSPGPAFVIGVVGTHLWGSREFGIALYLVQLLSGCLIGVLLGQRHPLPARRMAEETPRRDSLLTTLSHSVRTSAASMVTICGFVVCFAAITAGIGRMLDAMGQSALTPLFAAILEFTAGSRLAAELGGVWGAVIAGLAVGWSGLSVFAQSQVFATDAGLRMGPALIAKGAQGLLCGALMGILYALSGGIGTVDCAAVQLGEFPACALYGELGLLILFCLCPILPRRGRKNPRKSPDRD